MLGQTAESRSIRAMTKADLVERLANEFAHLGLSGARRVVDAVLGRIESGLADGQRVVIRDFGVFSRRSNPPRPRRNPRTGETLVPAGDTRAHFSAGRGLLHRINQV